MRYFRNTSIISHNRGYVSTYITQKNNKVIIININIHQKNQPYLFFLSTKRKKNE